MRIRDRFEARSQSFVVAIPVDQFLEQLLGAFIVSRRFVDIGELGERHGQRKRIAGVAAEIGEQFESLGVAGESFGRGRERLHELVVLAHFDHGIAKFPEQRKRLLDVALFHQRLGNAEKQPEMRVAAHQLVASAVRGRFNLPGFQFQIDQQVRDFAAGVGFRMLLQNLDRRGVFSGGREDLRLQQERRRIGGVHFASARSTNFSASAYSPRSNKRWP